MPQSRVPPRRSLEIRQRLCYTLERKLLPQEGPRRRPRSKCENWRNAARQPRQFAQASHRWWWPQAQGRRRREERREWSRKEQEAEDLCWGCKEDGQEGPALQVEGGQQYWR